MNTENHLSSMVTNKPNNRQHCALCGCKKIIGIGWHKEADLMFCRECWPILASTIEWFEARCAILHKCIGQEVDKKPLLFTLLSKEQSHVRIEDGEWLTEKVIHHLSLPCDDISFEFISLKSSVAGTVESSGKKYQVKISKELEDNFRSVSAILIHELMHVYLNKHGICYQTQEEYEEATDLACILMGFGIPMINAKRAWNVDRTSLGGKGIEGGLSYHIIGYLSKKEIGYAFATFILNRGITLEEIKDKIDSQCLHIVTDGLGLEGIYRDRLATKHKAISLINQQENKEKMSPFSCPVCFQKMAVPTETIKRVGLLKIHCPKCHSVIHFDGKQIIKFIESLN
jgi:hypothetical protein